MVNFLKNFIDKEIVSKRVKLISLILFFIFTGFICISCGDNSLKIKTNQPSTPEVNSIYFGAMFNKDIQNNRVISRDNGSNFNEPGNTNLYPNPQNIINNGYNGYDSQNTTGIDPKVPVDGSKERIIAENGEEIIEENIEGEATGGNGQTNSSETTKEANDNNQNNNEGQNNNITGQDNNATGKNDDVTTQSSEDIKEESNNIIQGETDDIDFSNSANFKIEVDLSCQKVLIYYKDKLLKEWICSGGTEEKPTPKGEFKTTEKGEYFWNPRYNMGGYYWVRFYEDYLFHSVPFDKDNNIIQEEYDKLGTPASHGCIRLEVENARWLYEMLPPGVKVNIY